MGRCNLLSLSLRYAYGLLLLSQFSYELQLLLLKGLPAHFFQHSHSSITIGSDRFVWCCHLLTSTVRALSLLLSHEVVVWHKGVGIETEKT